MSAEGWGPGVMMGQVWVPGRRRRESRRSWRISWALLSSPRAGLRISMCEELKDLPVELARYGLWAVDGLGQPSAPWMLQPVEGVACRGWRFQGRPIALLCVLGVTASAVTLVKPGGISGLSCLVRHSWIPRRAIPRAHIAMILSSAR